MIRSFIAIELKDKETIEKIISFSSRLKKNQNKLKLVEPENLHLTIKFLGSIEENIAPKIYSIVENDINQKFIQGQTFHYKLKGVGQFNKFTIIWIKLIGDISFLQKIKDNIENLLYNNLNINRDNRPQFKPHLTIARLKKNKINYKTFETFKKIISENKDLEYGSFTINQLKLKKSILTSNGPIYSDLLF